MFSIAGRSIVPSLVLAGSVCIVRAHVADDNMSDDLPMSVVMWICPDEPFAAGIGKPRHYRKAFETKEGLVKATARWWVDDTGSVFVDGTKMPQSAMMVDQSVDLTGHLKKPGRHVISIEGTNLAAAGGVCVSIDLEYADGRHESVYTDGSWKCAKDNGSAGRLAPPAREPRGRGVRG